MSADRINRRSLLLAAPALAFAARSRAAPFEVLAGHRGMPASTDLTHEMLSALRGWVEAL